MKITRLQAENFKIIKAIDIRPGDGPIVPIRGKNAQGKSSTLDAIQAALGGRGSMPDVPVRSGQSAGAIRLELDDGALMVRRIFDTDGKDQLVVELTGENGKTRPTSPQKMLDSLFASVAFDPLAFTRLKPADQLDVLRGMVDIEFDIAASEQADKADYEARRDTNRDIKRLEAEIFGMGEHEGLPDKPFDVAKITSLIASAAETNGVIERELIRRQQVKERLVELDRLVETAQLAIRGYEQEIRELSQTKDADIPAKVDIAELQATQAEAQKVNQRIEMRDRKRAAQLLLNTEREKSDNLTARMTEREAAREAAMAAANMPVPGLSFGNGAVLFNGVPFDQASSAEQLRVSTAIGMAGNPKLRVMLVRDGSLLDEEGQALLAAMAEEHDFQFWVESVGSGEVGIILQDGAVAGADEPEPIDKGATRKASKAEVQTAAEIAREAEPEQEQEPPLADDGTEGPSNPEDAPEPPVGDDALPWGDDVGQTEHWTPDDAEAVDEPAVEEELDDDEPLSGPVPIGESLFDD